MKFLIIGDIVGRSGRNIIKDNINNLKSLYNVDIVIANGENASGGNGLTEKNAKELFDCGIDIITMGNHVWDKKEIIDYIDKYPFLIRPANYPEPCPGRGYNIYTKSNVRIGIINLSGVIYLNNLISPFDTFDNIYKKIRSECDLIIIDFHGEATSEKIAMGYYVDGKASLIFGTHTHVQTADRRILAGGTGYITDIGMTGPYNGVLGVEKDIIIQQYKTKRPIRYELATGEIQVNCITADINEKTGLCQNIENFIHIY